MKQLNVTIEREYVEAFDRAAGERGWSKVDTMRHAIAMLAREDPPRYVGAEACARVYQPALDSIGRAVARNDLRAAAEEINRLPDGSIRDFALFLALNVIERDRVLRTLAAENAGRELIAVNGEHRR